MILLSCSRKKDRFINRNWHALNTKYNTLYNGEVAFQEGRKQLIDNYEDNYWKQLPIERLEVRDEIYLEGDNGNSSFARAEEKSIKAIQKHSMNIKGWERNKQIDESFMLLGKARYFDQRFIQALEAFNYILYKYPSSNNINNARIWKAKTLVRLNNNEGALKLLKNILRDVNYIQPQEISDAAAMLAQTYVNLKHKDSAIAPLKLAIENTKIKEEKGRYHYILGQLYNTVKEYDSANFEFDKIIKLNRRIPREYLINAYLAKARNLEIESTDQIAFLDILNKLESNWENRPFLDKIYYEKAIFFFGIDSMKLAEKYYEKSLRTDTQDRYLRSLNYETLARIHFNRGNFEKSGLYMDSTLVFLDEKTKRYRVVKKKRDNIEGVIQYEGIIRKNDSILYLTSLSPANQLLYFQKYTDSIKELREKRLKKRRRSQLGASQLLNAAQTSTGGSSSDRVKNSRFYFYNESIVKRGKTQFQAVYGDRELVDNWHLMALSKPVDIDEEFIQEELDYEMIDEKDLDPQQYISKIPTDTKVIDSLKFQLKDAYFQLGVIYKEQLSEYDVAADRFEYLLANNPPDKYVLPAKYNLYKIYQAVGNFIREEKWRQNILEEHPESRYASIVRDPFKASQTDVSKVDKSYTSLYKKFKDQKYPYVLKTVDLVIDKLKGDPESARFELLKAMTLGKMYGAERMLELLNHISVTYPKAPEGEKAKSLIEGLHESLLNAEFLHNSEDEGKFKVLFVVDAKYKKRVRYLKTKIETLIKNRNFVNQKVSVDYYDTEKVFVLVHGLKSKGEAIGMRDILTSSKRGNVNLSRYKPITISSYNYKLVQSKKSFDDYMKKRDVLIYDLKK